MADPRYLKLRPPVLPARRRIVVLGDSIATYPYLTGTNQRCWPELLRGLLGPGWSVLPMGVPSRPFADWADDDQLRVNMDPYLPTDIVLACGANDFANSVALAQVKVDARALIDLCMLRDWCDLGWAGVGRRHPRIHIVTTMPLNLSGADETARIGWNYAWLLTYTSAGSMWVRNADDSTEDVWGIIDFATAVAPAASATWERDDFTIDAVHPTTEGGRFLARIAADYFLTDDYPAMGIYNAGGGEAGLPSDL